MDIVAEPMFDPLRAPLRGNLAAMAGSLLGHVAIVAAALFVAQPRALVAPPPVAIEVELVPPPSEAPAASPAPPAPGLTAAVPQLSAPQARLEAGSPPTGGPAARDTPSGTEFTATHLYTGKLLTEPKMAQVRRELGTLSIGERVVQLCNIEALEQIHLADPAIDPDTLVGYAFADLEQRGLNLSAAGGAFRSRRHWYAVSYHCTAGADLASVSAFSFRLGDEIPRAEWDAHNLTAEDADE